MSGLALFGGTFDPIHNAHLRLAETAAERCGLERILFIPSANPPHRSAGPFAPYEDRYSMVELACQADVRFEASRLEAGEQTSYSIQTIEKVRASEPGELYFLIGADAFAEIQTWHRWGDVVASVTFLVASRPGANYRVPAAARVVRLEELQLSISSSQVRQELRAGTKDVPLPPAVRCYIESHGLYRSRT